MYNNGNEPELSNKVSKNNFYRSSNNTIADLLISSINNINTSQANALFSSLFVPQTLRKPLAFQREQNVNTGVKWVNVLVLVPV